MFKMLTMREQLNAQMKENAALKAKLAKAESDLDYLAMMSDVELETEGQQNEQI